MNAKCACLNVKYSPKKHSDGTFTAEWKCKACGTIFKKENNCDLLRDDFKRLQGFHWFWIGFYFCFFLIGYIAYFSKVWI